MVAEITETRTGEDVQKKITEFLRAHGLYLTLLDHEVVIHRAHLNEASSIRISQPYFWPDEM